MGVKLAQATVSAGSLAALIPGAPKSWQPEQNLPFRPPTCGSSPRGVSKGWRRDLSLKLPLEPLQGLRECGNGVRNAELAIGGGGEMGAKLVSAHHY